ncbi:RNA-binding protein [Natronospora cellulosivora (SeqCode)]
MVSRYHLGEIVISKAGRDINNAYIIVEKENDAYVKVADGINKRVEYPKRKNIKHLKLTGDIVEELSIWLDKGKRIRNEDIKLYLKDYQKNEEAN